MRSVKLYICLLFVIAFLVLFNARLGTVPPIGKFMHPAHGFMANAETKKDVSDAMITFPDPEIHGSVYFDDRLVPHVFADNDISLYYIQGYLHAKFRLWQMEIQTRAAAGRLSEVLGDGLLEYDRLQRRLGMGYAAEHALAAIEEDEHMYACLQAYTPGVNAYIQPDGEHIRSYDQLPIEYKLLDYQPELWTPIKSMYLLKYMASDLSGFDNDLEYTNILQKIGSGDFNLLFPNRPDGIVPIIPDSAQIHYAVPDKPDYKASTSSPYSFDDLQKGAQSTRYNEIGSNNWAVAGSKTKTGNPILCNDPHLQLNLPSLWFEMQLHTPDMNCYGVSLPGAPAIVIGFNDSISWGMTNAGWDVRDWYNITFTDPTEKQYITDSGNQNISFRIETISVRGGADYIDTVRYTSFGPLVYNGFRQKNISAAKADAKENLAMRWAAHDPSMEFKTLYLLNHSRNYADYRASISYFECPAQNFIFACTNGDIAITEHGKFPVKYPGEGRFVLDGKADSNIWKTFIPESDLPATLNPAQGFIVSANQHPTGPDYPYYYTGFDYEFYRNRVLNTAIQHMQQITVEDMQHLQQNTFNLMASEVLPVMLDHLNGEANQKYADALRTWNFEDNAEIPEPVYFQIWWDDLYALLWDEFSDSSVALIPPNYYNTIHILHTESNDFSYYDVQETKEKETLTDIVTRTYNTMVASVDSITKASGDPKWYTWKNTSIMHLAQLPAFSRTQIKVGGYRNIVNAVSENHGPSWRMVVEMSTPINAYGIYPGGQSGNPGSAYYDNFIDDWAEGKYHRLAFYSSAEEAERSAMFQISCNTP